MRSALKKQGLEHKFTIDSAGTGGWHVGNTPDRRMRDAAKSAGHAINGSARQVCKKDFTDFDWVFCMDYENYENLKLMGANPDKTHLLLEFIKHQSVHEVPDPYYGGDDGFTDVIRLVDDAVHLLIDELLPTTS